MWFPVVMSNLVDDLRCLYNTVLARFRLCFFGPSLFESTERRTKSKALRSALQPPCSPLSAQPKIHRIEQPALIFVTIRTKEMGPKRNTPWIHLKMFVVWHKFDCDEDQRDQPRNPSFRCRHVGFAMDGER